MVYIVPSDRPSPVSHALAARPCQDRRDSSSRTMENPLLSTTATVVQGYTFPATVSPPLVLDSTALNDQSASPAPPRPLSTEEWVARLESASFDAISDPLPPREQSPQDPSPDTTGPDDANHVNTTATPLDLLKSSHLARKDSHLVIPQTPTTPSSLESPHTSPSETKCPPHLVHLITHDPTPVTTFPTQDTISFTTHASPSRNPFTRRRSSQKPSLNLIIEDPSPPTVSISPGCTKDDSSPGEHGTMLVCQRTYPPVDADHSERLDERLVQLAGKVPRRAFSMNDLARHEHEYPVGKSSTSGAVVGKVGTREVAVVEGIVSGRVFRGASTDTRPWF